MEKMRICLLKSIAIISGIIGLYLLFKDFPGNYYTVLGIFSGRIPYGAAFLSLLVFIIIVLRLLSSYGLFRLTIWGRNLSIGVLVCDFMVRLSDFIYTWTYYIRNPEKKAIAEEMLKQIERGEANGAIVMKVSMIPSYIIAAISLVSVIMLLKVKMKDSRAQPVS